MKERFAMDRRGIVAGALGVVALSIVAHAEVVTFQVDPSRSTLSLSGAVRYYFNGSVFGFGAQAAGALDADFGGTITGDLVGSSLSLLGGSAIMAQANPAGAFLPVGPGTVDVFGMLTASAGNVFPNRMYDIVLDLSGGTASPGSAFGGNVSYTGGSGGIFPFFDAAPQSLAGVTAPNTAVGLVDLTISGDVQTLTIPINANLILFGNGTGVETRLTGSLVATRMIPAPGAAGLWAAGALLCGRRRRRA